MEYDYRFKTYYAFLADADLTDKLLRNLFDNARKHVFPGKLFGYLWQNYVYRNEIAKTVLLWRCDKGADVPVKLFQIYVIT